MYTDWEAFTDDGRQLKVITDNNKATTLPLLNIINRIVSITSWDSDPRQWLSYI